VAGEIVQYVPPAGMEEYRPRILMDAEEAKTLDDQLRKCMLAVLRENVDYGTIPGAGDKKNLLKPGAEKLLQWFGFGSRSVEVKTERDDPERPSGIADRARRVGVTYRTEVTKTVPGGGEVVVATCEGYAGYDEDRYYATAEEARAKAESKERANAARYKRGVNTSKWEFITADYRAPWNTLIKMSQKRSYVGAAIDATGAAGLFTQDMEDVSGTAAVPAAVAEAGRAAIAKLPQAVATELDAWYHALNWPDPGTWDAEQWCTALVKAGNLSGGQAPPPQEPWQERPAPAARPAAAAKQEEEPQERPLPPSVDLEAQALAEEASKVASAEELAALWPRASEERLAATIREPGGTYLGTLRAYFTYCENTLQQPAGSPA
jgi:hypothetical protein